MFWLEFKTSLIKIRARITANELPKVGEFLAFHAIKYGEYFHYMSSVFSAGKRLRLRYLIQPRILSSFEPLWKLLVQSLEFSMQFLAI